ncbi:MAG: CpaF family protein [Deltaproteobacteria bacterium]|nr:CpaF family protein [Desulfitobacteriaceae bacterium]MDI6855088.1 CpaF family protein [Deltaproteobacteria bacterium]
MAWLPDKKSSGEASKETLDPSASRSDREKSLNEIKKRLHRTLVERLDVAQLENMEETLVAAEIRRALSSLLAEDPFPLNADERARIAQELEFEILGLGPLEPLVRDNTISDILVNRYDEIYIERFGLLYLTDVRFRDNAHLMKIIHKIVSNIGRRIDESSPMVDARLPDGSRVNAIIPPLALDGPILSIRRFMVMRPTMEEVLSRGSLIPIMAEVMEATVKAKLNILISGGTGSGKTTLLNILSTFLGPEERIVTVEDAAELQLQKKNVCRLETRPPNIEGKGEITQRDLVRNALRMRPDRIIVGEVRGPEVMDMFQAMNTGHEGSMTTIHANSPRDALLRLETMVNLAGYQIPQKALRHLISSSLDVVIHLTRHSDGVRRVVSISEITGMEGEVISLQDIFVFDRHGMADDGKVLGQYVATGVRPRFADRCRIYGVPIPDAYFMPPASGRFRKSRAVGLEVRS